MMRISGGTACSHQEISGLGEYKDGKSALIDFCTLKFGKPYRRIVGRHYFYSFYVFSAAVPTEEKGVVYGQKNPTPYGDLFCAYLRENNLGEVVETPAKVNVAFHPAHSNKVWVWAPDHDAVKAWWNKEIDTLVGPPKPAFVVPHLDLGDEEEPELDYGDDEDDGDEIDEYQDEWGDDDEWDDEEVEDDDDF